MSMAGLISGGAAYSRFDFPTYYNGGSTTTISATAHKFAVLVTALASGTVSKIHFRTATVTTGDTVRGSIQGIDGATGDPDGTIANSGNSAANVTVASSDDNAWKTTAAFTTDYTVTRGAQFFVVLDYPSYVAGNMQIQRSTQGTPNNFNYVDVYAASWTKTSSVASITLEQADGSFLPCMGIAPITSATNTSFNSSSGTNEYALRFVFAAPVLLSGFWYWTNNFSGDTEMPLYAGGATTDTTVIATAAAQDKDSKAGTSFAACFFFFTAPVLIPANKVYRVSIKPTTTTNVGYARPSAAENNGSLATYGIGTGWYESTRGGGNWTDDTTRPAAIFPVLVGAEIANTLSGGMQA